MSKSIPSAAAAKVMTAEEAMYIARRKPTTDGETALVHDALRVLSREYRGHVWSIECDVQRKLSAEELAVVSEAANAPAVPHVVEPAAAITSSDIVDDLVAIRDELANGIKPVFVIPKIWSLIGRIEADADLAIEQRMDQLMRELGAQLPPVRGGGHDDHEDICPEFLMDPAGWPAFPHPELDGYTYEMGPTPVDVLAASAPTWEPSDADWNDMYAMSGAGLSEADHYAAHACV